MPCNSVAVTRARITEQALVDLINQNQANVMDVMVSYFTDQYPNLRVVATENNTFYVGSNLLTLRNGELTDRAPLGQKSFLSEAKQLLDMLATRLFTDDVRQALVSRTTILSDIGKTVNDNGNLVDATEFVVRYGNIKLRIYTLPDANMQVFVDEGEFNQAKEVTLKLLKEFGTAGIDVKRTSEVESHRQSGVNHVHVHTRRH